MQDIEVSASGGSISAENIGGIRSTQVSFDPGVNVLVGRNATNRTSLLQALMAALGSDSVSLKSDADEGRVELSLGDATYTREIKRRSGGVTTEGDPFLDDPESADLFAFLLESNEIRRAVTRSDDLRDVIMRPIDTEEIQAEISRLRERRERLENEYADIEERKAALPGLEESRQNLTEQIEEKRSELQAKEAELEAADEEVEQQREEQEELESTLEELRRKRSELDDVRYRLDTERESLQELKRERNTLADDLADLPETPVGEIEEIRSRITKLREEKRTIQNDANQIRNVIKFNEEMVEEVDQEILSQISDDDDSAGEITDKLVDDTSTTCWTCGSTVERDQIEETVDNLREYSSTLTKEIREIDAEIEELSGTKDDLQTQRNERDRVERRLGELDGEIESAEENIERLQGEREELSAEIERLDDQVTEMEGSDDFVLDLHKEANELEYELGKLENELERVDDEISEIEARIEEQRDLEDEIDETKEDITGLRTKIERIEDRVIEEFNTHMVEVLGLLDYGNIERIWIEKKTRNVRDGRRKVAKSTFDLHVIRTTDSGTTYEDTVSNLSESEREVTGLILALAGYLAHDVYDEMPVMVLDSLEAIDSDRIASLVEYLTEYCDYLFVALLPEDAESLTGHNTVEDI